MAKKKSYVPEYIIIGLLAAAILIVMVYLLSHYHLNDEVEFSPDLDVVENPMMGYAPNAESVDLCSETGLVFIKLRWADWEPEMGQYDIEYLESNFHISQWRDAGKHAVLRFICDEPGDEKHADIPRWLLAETGDGTYYTGTSGSGYSPNYENEYFISRHALAVSALADYFNQDSFLAYVEFGSLGHWGEWHARDSEGGSLMPSAEVCWDYILAYTEQFQNVRFLMRRSYSYAQEAEMGLYNDMLGDQRETDRWLEWTVSGGTQETVLDPIRLLPYGDFWKTAPVGGEITSGQAPETLYNDNLSGLLKQMESCHLTFVGPNIPSRQEYPAAYDAVLRRMGYKYYVSRLSASVSFADDTLNLQLDWENAGTVPLYWDWPVMLKIYDAQGNLAFWETLDLRLSQLSPGDKVTTVTRIPISDDIRSGFSVGISIKSYDEKNSVTLAMDTEPSVEEDCRIIYSSKRK